jgi:hypothetical protein
LSKHIDPHASHLLLLLLCTIVSTDTRGAGTGQEPQHQHKQSLSMEPISKRQKLANEQQQRSLLDQPDSFVKFVVSFWDFQSLLAFRQTRHRFKHIADEEMKRRSRLEAFPVDWHDRDGSGEASSEASLRLEWSEQFRDRDAVLEYALGHADPGGQVSLDADYDKDRARDLIHSRGWVDVEDFLGNNNSDSDADEAGEEGYSDEIGWNVSASFRSISPENKWKNAKALLTNEEGEVAPSLHIRQCAFGLLLDAQPSSLRYAYAKYEYRHTDYPSGGNSRALLFLTLDGTQVQLEHSFVYITT